MPELWKSEHRRTISIDAARGFIFSMDQPAWASITSGIITAVLTLFNAPFLEQTQDQISFRTMIRSPAIGFLFLPTRRSLLHLPGKFQAVTVI
jgi:hypothetical protein